MKAMSLVGRRLTLIATLFAVGGACTASERVMFDRDGAASGNTGTAGDDPSGAGGTGAGDGTAGAGAGSGSAGSGAGGIIGASGYPGTSTGAAAEGGRSGTAGAGGTHVDAGAGSAGASGTAGAGGADPMEAMYGSYATYIGPLLNLRCAGCHLGTQIQGGFVVGYAGITAHVSNGTSACSGLDASKLRVVPGKSANSLVYIKTNDASPPGGCGGHMPYSGTSLPADEEAGLKYWIDTGARP
jgi:hypothetical protein